MNLAWEAQYPREEQVEGIVRRLRAHGINMVRLTYLDSPPPRGLLRSTPPPVRQRRRRPCRVVRRLCSGHPLMAVGQNDLWIL